MQDFWTSLLRSAVPAIVSAVVNWLAHKGFEIDANGINGLEATLFALGYTLYYSFARLLELYVNPKLGWLLGSPKAPVYTPQVVTPEPVLKPAE
jgi:hypothetical protein